MKRRRKKLCLIIEQKEFPVKTFLGASADARKIFNFQLRAETNYSPFWNPFCLTPRKKRVKWYSCKIPCPSNDRGETWTDPWWRSADRSIRQETGTSFVHPYASNGVDSSSCVPQFIIVDRIDGSLFSPARFHPPFVSFFFSPLFFPPSLFRASLLSLNELRRTSSAGSTIRRSNSSSDNAFDFPDN